MEKHGGHDHANEMCVGDVCFVQPYAEYVPPTYYQPVPHREYRWKLSGKIVSRPGFCLRFQHMLPLPNSLGMRDDARWRWQWIPLSLIVGLKIDSMFDGQLEKRSIQVGNCSRQIASESPYVRIKILNPICGNLALQPVLQVLPTPALSMKREFKVAGTRLTVRMKFEANNGSNMLKGHRCMFHINWHPAENASIQGSSVQGLHHVQYSKDFSLTEDCRVVVSAVAKGPSDILKQGLFKLCESFPLKLKFDSVKISHSIRSKVKRVPPLPPPLYLKSAKHIGNKDVITVVPGHWIDPGVEVGASGEREFNLEVVNVLEKQLCGNGWEVLRPDRDAPLLSWEEYLNWVSKQTLKGIPVLEIHGQGSTADYRGIVLGVIGDAAAPLTKELALNFGYFQMDWRELGVSRRGGVIIESFNADEVLQMAPWHRKWAVRRLSNLIVSSIERAGAKNRAAHKICIDLDPEDDLVQIDKNCLKKQTLLFKQG